MNVSSWLAYASNFLIPITSTPRLEAAVLLADRLGVERTALLGMPDRELSSTDEKWLRSALDRRGEHVPMAYILGYKDFADFRLKVTPDVLIPRPETESILERAIEIANHLSLRGAERSGNLVIHEIGTGSGAIAIGLARALPHAKIIASDISELALAVARENIADYGLEDQIELVHANLASHIDHARLIVANLPYLPEGLSVSEDVQKEPGTALWSGADGLDHYRNLLAMGSFDIAVIELGADQYSKLADWLGVNMESKITEPVRNIDGTVVGMVIANLST